MSLVLYVIVFPCSPIPTKFGIRQIQEWLLDGGAALHLITSLYRPFQDLGFPLVSHGYISEMLFPLLTSFGFSRYEHEIHVAGVAATSWCSIYLLQYGGLWSQN